MLKVENLSITYNSTGQKVIDNLSFEVKKGEIVAIMGPSGCGKTTLLTAIQGLKRASMTLDGQIIVAEDTTVRTVFQEPRLFPWKTAFENIALVVKPDNLDKITSDLEAVALSGHENDYPDELSLGMQHRVNFLRAYASGADIILLDEPFSSLDHRTKMRIMTDFKDKIKKEKTTTLFVTHNETDAKFLAEKIIYLPHNV